MVSHLNADDALLQRLPLPLAQLYRRAHNALTPLARHLKALNLWEAGLKMLGITAIVEHAHGGAPDPIITEALRKLARPSLGDWWQFVRLLLPPLAERGDEAFGRLRELVLGKPRGDLPRTAGLDVLLLEFLENKTASRSTVCLAEVIDRLIRFRNKSKGHGAAEQFPEEMQDRLGRSLLLAFAEVFSRLDVLAGGRLLYLAEIRLIGKSWIVKRLELKGESPRLLLPELEIPHAESVHLPFAEQVNLEKGGLRSLHPLMLYDIDSGETFFLSAQRKKKRAEYLCYTTGRIVDKADLGTELGDFLARTMGSPVTAKQVETWSEQSADEPVEIAGVGGQRTLGEFELLSQLGRGGMGVVYRAWQPSLGRQVALKKLLRGGDARAEARFRREIRALGQVTHPHLVEIFTSGSDGEHWFYAMELIEGADLAGVCEELASVAAADVSGEGWNAALHSAGEKQRRQEKPVSESAADKENANEPAAQAWETQDIPHEPAAPARNAPVASLTTAANPTPLTPANVVEHPSALAPAPGPFASHIVHVVDIVRQVAQAAHALHEAGVVHRDIKPGNIMLGRDGRHAMLMDLGLAQWADEAEGRVTRTRQFVGTLRYASPEQLLAVERLDRRSDVYSLGATLWELLTLRPLFGADDKMPIPQLMQKIQVLDPERIRKHNPRVPADLEAIAHKCLEKDRSRRYGTALEMADDLERWSKGEAVQAQAPSLGYLLGKQIRRHRLPLTLAAVFLAAAMVGIVAAFVQISAALVRETAALRNETAASNREKEARIKATREMEIAELLRIEAQEKGRQVKSQLAQNYLQRSVIEFDKGFVANSVNLMLQAYLEAPENDPLKRSYRHLLAGDAQFFGRFPLLHGGRVKTAIFSPDGKRILTASEDKTALLWDAATGKPLGQPMQHADHVTAAVFSPDGKRILTGSDDQMAQLWDAATGKPLHDEPMRHKGRVVAVAFSPDGNTVLTASYDQTARLWDAANGKPLHYLKHKGRVVAAVFSPDGKRVLTGSHDQTARLWDTATGRPYGEPLQHQENVVAAAFSPDGKSVLTASYDQTARLWNAATGQPLAQPMRHDGPVVAAVFSPDGKSVLTGSHDETARLWDAATGNPLHDGQPLQHHGRVVAVAFSPDGKSLLTASHDKTAQLWDAQTGERQSEPMRHARFVVGAVFSPDGKSVLTASDDRTARLWDLTAGKPQGDPLRHRSWVTAVAFSPDGKTILTSSDDSTARLWYLSGKPRGEPMLHDGRVVAALFSPDGKSVLTGSDDFTARLWDAATGKPLTDPLPHENGVTSAAFSPDGRLVATGSLDGKARLWNAATGQQLGQPLSHDGAVSSLAFSPDSKRLLTGSRDARARLWNIDTGTPLLLPHPDDVVAVAFSPDGKRVLTGSLDTKARLWDPITGLELGRQMRHEDPVVAVAFSPDGSKVLTASYDSRARLWDAASGEPLGQPLLHKAEVVAAAFSPDGNTVLTASQDKTARLWDAATGQPLGPPLHHRDKVAAAAFSPDGQNVLTGSWDNTALLWKTVPLPPDEPLRLRAFVRVISAKTVNEYGVTRDLFQEEWLKFHEELRDNGGDWRGK